MSEMDEQINSYIQLKKELNSRINSKRPIGDQFVRLPISEIIKYADFSMDIISNADLQAKCRVGMLTIHKMRSLLLWLLENYGTLSLSPLEAIVVDKLKKFGIELMHFSPPTQTQRDNSEFSIQSYGDVHTHDEDASSIVSDIPDNVLEHLTQRDNNDPGPIPEESASASIMTSQVPTSRKRVYNNFSSYNETLIDMTSNSRKVQKTFQRVQDTPIPDTWKIWNNTEMEPVSIVKHDSINPQDLKMKLVDAIMNGQITNIIGRFIASEDALRIISPDELTKTNNNNILKEWDASLNLSDPKIAEPRIRLSRVYYKGSIDNHADIYTHVERIFLTSGFEKNDKWSIETAYTTNILNFIDIIVNISPAMRDRLHDKRGILYFAGRVIKVTDYFTIRQCNRCLMYTHKRCQSQQRCKCCAGFHSVRDCPHTNDPSKKQCLNCKDEIMNKHRTDDWECQTFQRKLKESIQSVNYMYRWIMKN